MLLVQIPPKQFFFQLALEKKMFSFVVLPCFDLGLRVPIYVYIYIYIYIYIYNNFSVKVLYIKIGNFPKRVKVTFLKLNSHFPLKLYIYL